MGLELPPTNADALLQTPLPLSRDGRSVRRARRATSAGWYNLY